MKTYTFDKKDFEYLSNDVFTNKSNIKATLALSKEGRESFGLRRKDYPFASIEISDENEVTLSIYNLDQKQLNSLMGVSKNADILYSEFEIKDLLSSLSFERKQMVFKEGCQQFKITENTSELLELINESIKTYDIPLSVQDIISNNKQNDSSLRYYVNMGVAGYITNSNGAEILIVTHDKGYEAIPYFVSYDTSGFKGSKDDLESAIAKALENVPQNDTLGVYTWTKEVLETYDSLKKLISDNKLNDLDAEAFSTPKHITYTFPNGEQTNINLYYMQDGKTLEFADFEGDNYASDILYLSERLVNKDKYILQKHNEINELQEFYDNVIVPLKEIPYDMLTLKEQDQIAYYSDKHKEIYGVRPLNIINSCTKANKTKGDIEK